MPRPDQAQDRNGSAVAFGDRVSLREREIEAVVIGIAHNPILKPILLRTKDGRETWVVPREIERISS